MPAAPIRFFPDGDEVAFISFNTTKFNKDISALIINESHQGACFVVNISLIPKGRPLAVGQTILAQIGHMDPLKATIRWLKEVDTNLLKIGIELLE